MNGNFASGDLTITWNGIKLNSGWGEDVFFTATPNGPLKEMTIGADGNGTISKLADRGATLELTLVQTAVKQLKDISKIAAAETLVADAAQLPFAGIFTVEDPLGNCANFVCLNATLVDMGSHSFGKTVGERTITWKCDKFIETDSIESVMSNISSYIKD